MQCVKNSSISSTQGDRFCAVIKKNWSAVLNKYEAFLLIYIAIITVGQ